MSFLLSGGFKAML